MTRAPGHRRRLRRFAVPAIWTCIGAAATMLAGHRRLGPFVGDLDFVVRLVAMPYLAALAVALFAEGRGWRVLAGHGLAAAAAGGAVAAMLQVWPARADPVGQAMLSASLAALVLVVFLAPFLGRRDDTAFRGFVVRLTIVAGIAATATLAVVLLTNLVFVQAGLQQLFADTRTADLVVRDGVVILVLAIGGVAASALVPDPHAPPPLPQRWPATVAMLASGAALVGGAVIVCDIYGLAVASLLVAALPRRLVDRHRYLLSALFALLAVAIAAALWLRLGGGGVAYPTYAIVLAVAPPTAAVAAFAVSGTPDLRWPALAALLALLIAAATAGPARDLALDRDVGRIADILAAAGKLKDGRIDETTPPALVDDALLRRYRHAVIALERADALPRLGHLLPRTTRWHARFGSTWSSQFRGLVEGAASRQMKRVVFAATDAAAVTTETADARPLGRVRFHRSDFPSIHDGLADGLELHVRANWIRLLAADDRVVAEYALIDAVRTLAAGPPAAPFLLRPVSGVRRFALSVRAIELRLDDRDRRTTVTHLDADLLELAPPP